MRTARSRTSGEYLVDLFIAPSSQRLEPPENPGRFTVQSVTHFAKRKNARHFALALMRGVRRQLKRTR
jgi:hypothetical protein